MNHEGMRKAVDDAERLARFEASLEWLLDTHGDLLRGLAEYDKLPALTDACRNPDGSCNGKCA